MLPLLKTTVKFVVCSRNFVFDSVYRVNAVTKTFDVGPGPSTYFFVDIRTFEPKEESKCILKFLTYSYLVSCCPISDLFGKREPILGEA